MESLLLILIILILFPFKIRFSVNNKEYVITNRKDDKKGE